MGSEISRESFAQQDYAAFRNRLYANLHALETLLAREDFGKGDPSLGLELELSLVDDRGHPAPLNRALIEALADDRFSLELNRFNLEFNSTPERFEGRPFTRLFQQLQEALTPLFRVARKHGARVAQIGILPTLQREDLRSDKMTSTARFRALSRNLKQIRGEPFSFHISGEDRLLIQSDDVGFEGANTSLQIHLRVSPKKFARLYNACQLATPLALAVAGNSPIFLEHLLWEETRIALFKQAVDLRTEHTPHDQRVARVHFGRDWLKGSALDLFRESVAQHEPLLPIVDSEDPIACVRHGGVPKLSELRLHQGTVWRWNRPVYDPTGSGHLRIELRSLPSGPTLTDMHANALFLVGLSLGLAEQSDQWTSDFPFNAAHQNFYRAAQVGLEAELNWLRGSSLTQRSARSVVLETLDVAAAGLSQSGIDPAESDSALEIIRERARSGRTGAAFQRRQLKELERHVSRRQALPILLDQYLELSATEAPVHTWPWP